MNEKITQQELIELLIQRNQMNPADAKAFVEEFLSLVKEAVVRHKYVQVKGLGVFKLVAAETCFSAGEKTHTGYELSFLPEAGVRDMINKPFAHFETVLLKENVRFDDLETDEETKAEADDIPVKNDDEAKEAGETIVNENIHPENTSDVQPTVLPGRRKNAVRFPWCMIACVLFIGILVGGGIMWGILSGRRYIPQSVVRFLEKQESLQHIQPELPRMVAEPANISDTLTRKDTVPVRKDTLKKAEASLPVVSRSVPKATAQNVKPETPRKRETLADTVEYDINGTQGTHTIASGESLARISLKYYGNKRLWPYLVRHNRSVIKNPDNVPIGTVIRIPALTPKGKKP